MLTFSCPRCQNPSPRPLDATSQLSIVDYYRCERCGLVWNQPKNCYADGRRMLEPVRTVRFFGRYDVRGRV